MIPTATAVESSRGLSMRSTSAMVSARSTTGALGALGAGVGSASRSDFAGASVAGLRGEEGEGVFDSLVLEGVRCGVMAGLLVTEAREAPLRAGTAVAVW